MRLSRARKRTILSIATCLAIALACASIFLLLREKGIMSPLELRAHDWFLRRLPHDPRMSDMITLIGLTEADIKWLRDKRKAEIPLRDDVFVEIIDKALELKPRTIGLDFIRDGERGPLAGQTSNSTEELTRRLAGKGGARVKTVFRTVDELDESGQRILTNVDYFPGYRKAGLEYAQRIPRVGSVDFSVDVPHGVTRRGIVSLAHRSEMRVDGDESSGRARYLSLPALLAADGVSMLSRLPDSPIAPLKPGEVLQAVLEFETTHIWPGVSSTFEPWLAFGGNEGGYVNQPFVGIEFMLDFRGGVTPDRRFRQYSVRELLDGKIPQDALEEKLLLIGQIARSVEDNMLTPVDVRHAGVEVAAHATDQLLRSWWHGARPIRGAGELIETVRLACWTLAGALISVLVRGPWRFALALLLGLIAIYLSTDWFFQRGTWLASVTPAMSFFSCATFTTSYMAYRERAAQQLTQQVFSRHVDVKVVEKLMRNPEEVQKNESIDAAVLFTDLVGFGKASEQFTADELITWLNEYMGPMSQVVLDHRGMINKYMGDAIMAVFGAPFPAKEGIVTDARNAVRCALAMRRTLIDLNAHWISADKPTARMRLGIMTGELVAGMLGSDRRTEYTVIGDVVNKAARLEACAKELMSDEICIDGCRIFVGEPVYLLLRSEFQFQEMPPVEFKAGEQPVKVFSVIGDAPVSEADMPTLRLPQPQPTQQREAARSILDEDEDEQIATGLGR